LVYAHPSVPAKNLSELVAYAKANPGKVNFYSSGNGGLPHLTGELLNNVAGIQTVHIAYKGSAPGMNDLIGGQVQLGYDTVAIGLQHIKTGRLRALAIMADSRTSVLPDVPSTKELGFPELESTTWFAFLAPKGTSPEVVKKVNQTVNTLLTKPALREKMTNLGYTIMGGTSQQLAAYMKSEIVKWGEVVEFSGAKID
jgi:tripartite-type tricarboxylate transporter receptor subunit TctC